MTRKNEDKKRERNDKGAFSKPDPNTLHKTDPQENMKGPVSSVMQEIKETTEKNDQESKEEADRKKDKNI